MAAPSGAPRVVVGGESERRPALPARAGNRLGGGDAEAARAFVSGGGCCNVIHDPTMAVADVVENPLAGSSGAATPLRSR